MRQTEIQKYNPRQTPPAELVATFVARQEILEGILDELRGRADAKVNQHFLIIGPRGIGKTNLLLMIRYTVCSDEHLAAAYLPLQTAEEEYSIASLRDLFARILELLLEEDRDGDLATAQQSAADATDDEVAAELAIAAVKAFCERTGRKLLLLIDNLDLILDQQLTDDAELGRLRDLLMNESFLVLVGAAPTHFKEVSGYDRPLYNFFRTVDLEELTPEQMEELLRRHADLDASWTVLGRSNELRPRLKAVHHLTGGNPRLVLMFYRLCTGRQLPEIQAALEAILDSVTPYYKARLEVLPPQQRRLMDTFAKLGHPATPTELAREARLPPNQVTSVLKRLREAGFVTIAPQKRRKGTLYIVSERVFRIWHQMRFSSSRRRLQFLIDFLVLWYRTEDRGDIAEQAPNYDDRLGLAWASIRSCIESNDYDCADRLLAEQRRDDRDPSSETREIGILAPFAHAIAYWRGGEDPEVLDRLNPEVREIVEELIRRGRRMEEDRKGANAGASCRASSLEIPRRSE